MFLNIIQIPFYLIGWTIEGTVWIFGLFFKMAIDGWKKGRKG